VTNSCVQTIVGHRAEVWALACSPDGSRLVSGTNDERLRVWAVRDHDKTDNSLNNDGSGAPSTSAEEKSDQTVTGNPAALSRSGSVLPCRFMGHVSRTTSSGRCEALQFHNARTSGAAASVTTTTTLLGVQSGGRLVDVYRVRPESEAKKKLKRRLKRHREKAAAWQADSAEGKTTEEQRAEWAEIEAEAEADGGHASSLPVASDELELTGTLRVSEKVVSFAFLAQPKDQQQKRSITAANNNSSSADAVEWLTAKLLLSLATNALEVHQVSVLAQSSSASASTPAAAGGTAAAAPPPPQKLLRLDLPGHRSDPKAIAFSGDASLLASVAAGSLKVWSPETRQCLRSLDDLGQSPRFKALGWEAPHDNSSTVGPAKNPNASGGGGSVGAAAAVTAVCVLWLPGDQWLVVGTREGSLLLCDLASGSVAVRLDGAHKGTVASLALAPEGSSVASGGADGEVKFWDVDEVDEGEEVEDLEAMSDDNDDDDNDETMRGKEEGDAAVAAAVSDPASSRRKRMELVHAKTLKMGDDVTCVAFSKGRDPKKQVVCVATLDATVRVYFKDSLKFFLQLYGHKLPVTCMDVADDNTMLATGSHDKTIKLWGLDFGDCRRSLLAHSDSVTSLQFVPRTHYIFSASKDRNLKYVYFLFKFGRHFQPTPITYE